MTAELEFAAAVDALASGPDASARLVDLLREDHAVYDQRGTTAVVRMRGWVLLALARVGMPEEALLFVLEELDTGKDPYLVAAAARALRSCGAPSPDFAPFVMRALANIRYHNELVSFEKYGDYAVSSASTSPIRELLATLAWLGPHASGVLPELQALRTGLPKKLQPDADCALAAVRSTRPSGAACCALDDSLGKLFRSPLTRRAASGVDSIIFEDQDGKPIRFQDFFHGQPAIVVFFYTRCDNPLKCSLTVTKLARVQKLLAARGLDRQIRTAAITYDPAFDLPARLRVYAQDRSLRLGTGHRVLRATAGFDALRSHFKLGVNFIESLVNRHRVELYILDATGRIASTWERIHWDEQPVVDRAIEVANEAARRTRAAIPGALMSVAAACLPKCPVCWMTYLSVFGVAGMESSRYFAALEPLLLVLLLVNVAAVWIRMRSTRRFMGPWLVSAGAFAIGLSRIGPGARAAAIAGVLLTLAGSLWSVAQARQS